MRYPLRNYVSRLLAVFTLVSAALVAVTAAPSNAATGDDVLINEILASTTGSDVEYVELFGTPGFSLDGLSIIGVEADVENSSLGNIDFRFDFGLFDVIGSNGFHLVGNELVFGVYAVQPDTAIDTNSLENSSATYALVATSTLPGDGSLPADGDVLDSIHLTDDELDPSFFGAPSIGPDGPFFPAGAARIADGVDTDTSADWVIGDFFLGSDNTPTAGGEVAEPTAASIMEIQGGAHLSPLDGALVVTTGVVTAVAFNGFYLQDPVGDGDDNTSDAIFVFGGQSGLAAGDSVSVSGVVAEFIPGGAGTGNLSITQLSAIDVEVLGAGELPTPVEIGKTGRQASPTTVISDSELPTNLQSDPAVFNPETDAIDFWESLEGMLVEVDRPVTVSATRTFNAFSSEFFTLASWGQGAVAPNDARTNRGGIELQADLDNTGDQNPERVQIQFDGTLYPAEVPVLNIDTRLDDVLGVVGYSFGNFEVNAIEEVRVIRDSNLRAETTPFMPLEDQLTVASYNVLNLAGDGSDVGQMATVGEHIAVNLAGPDIVALQEVQDDSGEANDGTTTSEQTLAALIAAIEAAGGPTYVGVDVAPVNNTQGGVPGGNIRNAFLYNPDRVSLVDLQDLNSTVLADVYGVSDPTAFDGSRVPLLGVFEFGGEQITVINNHFSSRFGSTPIFGGVQPFVQAGEDERAAQSTAINEVVDVLLAADGDANIAVVGDLNTFQWTDELLEDLPGGDSESGPVLTNLAFTSLNGNDADDLYSFVFDGNSQLLDHMFVTDSLLGGSTRFDVVHVNVDFARVSDDFGSDHEPLLARFKLN